MALVYDILNWHSDGYKVKRRSLGFRAKYLLYNQPWDIILQGERSFQLKHLHLTARHPFPLESIPHFWEKFGKTPNRNICWNSKGAVAILQPTNWQIGKFGQAFKESAWTWSQFFVCARFGNWGHLATNEACLSGFFIRWMRIWLSELSSSDGTRFPKTLSAEGVDSV